jgi:ATP-dependent DNA helicase PIF1
VLLREVIKALREKHKKAQDAVAVTASTGIAACNIGGQTLHSFSGIGLGEGTPESLATKIRRNKNATSRWLRCKVLIIDEGEFMRLGLIKSLILWLLRSFHA